MIMKKNILNKVRNLAKAVLPFYLYSAPAVAMIILAALT